MVFFLIKFPDVVTVAFISVDEANVFFSISKYCSQFQICSPLIEKIHLNIFFM